MGIDIERRLAEAGFPMFSTGEDKEELILSILKSKNIRYLKAIPLLLYRYDIDIKRIHSKTEQKALFRELVFHARQIFTEIGIEKELPLPLGRPSNKLNYGELKDEFQLHHEEGKELLTERHKIERERQTRMWLAQLFTRKERWIIGRIAEGKPISKTDYEYYSRKTRKNLHAIANLRDFARTQLPLKPRVDEDLFKLKKMLEQWLAKHPKYEEPEITSYHLFDHDKIWITFKEKGKSRYPLSQNFNTRQELKDIKEKEIRELLNRYTKADFR